MKVRDRNRPYPRDEIIEEKREKKKKKKYNPVLMLLLMLRRGLGTREWGMLEVFYIPHRIAEYRGS